MNNLCHNYVGGIFKFFLDLHLSHLTGQGIQQTTQNLLMLVCVEIVEFNQDASENKNIMYKMFCFSISVRFNNYPKTSTTSVCL